MPYTLQIRIVKGSPSTLIVDKYVEKHGPLYKKNYNVTAFSLLPKNTADGRTDKRWKRAMTTVICFFPPCGRLTLIG